MASVFFLTLLLRLNRLRLSLLCVDLSVAEDGGRAVAGSVLVLSCNDGLRVSRLLGGRGIEAAAAPGGERSAWLVFGLLNSMGVVLA